MTQATESTAEELRDVVFGANLPAVLRMKRHLEQPCASMEVRDLMRIILAACIEVRAKEFEDIFLHKCTGSGERSRNSLVKCAYHLFDLYKSVEEFEDDEESRLDLRMWLSVLIERCLKQLNEIMRQKCISRGLSRKEVLRKHLQNLMLNYRDAEENYADAKVQKLVNQLCMCLLTMTKKELDADTDSDTDSEEESEDSKAEQAAGRSEEQKQIRAAVKALRKLNELVAVELKKLQEMEVLEREAREKKQLEQECEEQEKTIRELEERKAAQKKASRELLMQRDEMQRRVNDIISQKRLTELMRTSSATVNASQEHSCR